MRLDAACQRALAYGNPHYRTIKTILEKALDPQRSELAPPSIATIGAFLRGPDALFTASNVTHEEVSIMNASIAKALLPRSRRSWYPH